MSASGRWMLDVQIDVGPHFFFIFCMNCSTLLVDKLYERYKEECYIELLSRIVKSINDDLTVIVFDSFGNKKLEKRIINKIEKIDNVERIVTDYSFNNKGLQFADNVCGVIRKHLSEIDYENCYEIISRKVIKC